MNEQRFIDNYVAAALWSSVDDNGEPLDGPYTSDDIAAAAMQEIGDDCREFLEQAADTLKELPPSYGAEQAGVDFWLTRNGHGAGFWDRGLPGDLGERLTYIADTFGRCDLYIGDDNRLYI